MTSAMFRPSEKKWVVALFAVALAIGTASRILYGQGLPLWFDETFTATIATQPDPPSLLHFCLTELTGPAFYMPMWAWVRLFGDSDASLRLPGLILSIEAPLVLYRWGHPDRTTRTFWAVAALLWLPAMPFANDARPYPQLFLLACVQAIAFHRLLLRPRTGQALAWTTVTALLALTHYASLAIGMIQGLLYLGHHRQRAMATWPALLPFILLAAWMAVHLPFVLGFARAHTAAAASGVGLFVQAPALLFGASVEGVLAILAVVTSLFILRDRFDRTATPDRLLTLSGILAVLVIIGFASTRAGSNPRYITPSMPALLFGLAIWGRHMLRYRPLLVAALFAILLISSLSILVSAVSDREIDDRHRFNLEQVSAWLMESRPQRLIFLWTDRVGNGSSDTNVAQVAGYAFRRAGKPIPVIVIHPRQGIDTSHLALAIAGQTPHTAILWIANDVQADHPTHVTIAAQDQGWDCRDFGGSVVTVTGCRKH